MSTDGFNASLDPLDRSWCADARVQLECEANALDAVTLARLSAARRRALAEASERAPELARGRRLPWFGGAVAASLLLALVLDRAPRESSAMTATSRPVPSANATQSTLPSAALLTSDVDVAVIADLEFYDWLEEQDAVL